MAAPRPPRSAAAEAIAQRRPPPLEFTPSRAYTIFGHGHEKTESFRVPPNCIIIVKARPGERLYLPVHQRALKHTIGLPLEVTANPLAGNHMSQLLEELKSVMVFKPGDMCPNYLYAPFSIMPAAEELMIIPFSGVVALSPELQADVAKTPLEMIPFPYTEYATRYLSEWFKYSIAPTPEELDEAVTEWEKNGTPYRQRHMRLGSILDLVQSEDGAWRDRFFIDQKTLCERFPGVYYNYVCRNIKTISDKVYEAEKMNWRNLGQPQKEVPRGYLNLRRSGNVPENERGLYLQAIGEAEARKAYMPDSKLSRPYTAPVSATPLSDAIRAESVGMMKMALAAGASLDERSPVDNYKPLDYLLTFPTHKSERMVVPMVKLLLEAGGDPNGISGYKVPFLKNNLVPLGHIIMKRLPNGKYEYPIIELLLKHGAQVTQDMIDDLKKEMAKMGQEKPGLVELLESAMSAQPGQGPQGGAAGGASSAGGETAGGRRRRKTRRSRKTKRKSRNRR